MKINNTKYYTTKQNEVVKQYSIGKLDKLDKDNYLIPAPCGKNIPPLAHSLKGIFGS